MREARFSESQSRAGQPASRSKPSADTTTPAKKVAKKGATKKVASPTTPAAASDDAADALCGHRNISGRTCTRERGHTAKSHRYS
ncbi:hypothetical protein ACFQ0K_18385 [Nocardioides caeni]|uniref:Uncharacterized protein n=1 Tax=Nocardioides caeni TaxID=574700 RepID=A0A4V4HK75_9ACTN|nr:hypothetical protein [Nocardioides caeni]THV13276.1 hypothetical protein E9934_09900 [Nocardioides caeni]